MKALRKNDERARLAVLMLYVMVALEAVSIVSSYLQYNLLVDMRNGVFVSQDQLEANDSREQIIAIVYLIAFIISIITFIQWFRRAYFNLHLRSTQLRHSEGWAAGAWFVPIFNLYAPVQIMLDLYEESKQVLKRAGFTEEYDLPKIFIGLWWTFWLLANFVSNIGNRFGADSYDVDSLINVTIGSIAANILSMAAAVLLILIIQKYSKVEPLLRDLRSEIDTIGQNVED